MRTLLPLETCKPNMVSGVIYVQEPGAKGQVRLTKCQQIQFNLNEFSTTSALVKTVFEQLEADDSVRLSVGGMSKTQLDEQRFGERFGLRIIWTAGLSVPGAGKGIWPSFLFLETHRMSHTSWQSIWEGCFPLMFITQLERVETAWPCGVSVPLQPIVFPPRRLRSA